MAVLVEAISVIVQRAAIDDRFKGRWPEFLRRLPNTTLCTDGTLVRVGFMTPNDALAYIAMLENRGLVFEGNDEAVDIAIADQIHGLMVPAPWLTFGRFPLGKAEVCACHMTDQAPGEVAVPERWKYEGSMSARGKDALNDGREKRMAYLRHENGNDVYHDMQTGKTVYVGRSRIRGSTPEAVMNQLQLMCRVALSVDPEMEDEADAPVAPRSKARVRVDAGMLNEARMIARGPGAAMPFAHFTLGLLLRVRHELKEAEAAFRRANALQPGELNTLLELVRCMGEQGKHGKALPFAREAVEAHPESAAAWGNLATCHIAVRERAEARHAIDEAMRLDPFDPINGYIRDNFEDYFL